MDLNVPRRAQYLHNAWKKHQDAVYWVDINLAIEKGTENWVQKLLDNQKEKLLDKQRDDLITCKMEETRPVPRISMLVLFAKNLVIHTERGDLLCLKTR